MCGVVTSELDDSIAFRRHVPVREPNGGAPSPRAIQITAALLSVRGAAADNMALLGYQMPFFPTGTAALYVDSELRCTLSSSTKEFQQPTLYHFNVIKFHIVLSSQSLAMRVAYFDSVFENARSQRAASAGESATNTSSWRGASPRESSKRSVILHCAAMLLSEPPT